MKYGIFLSLMLIAFLTACKPHKSVPIEGTYVGMGVNDRVIFGGAKTQVVTYKFSPDFTFTSSRNGNGIYWISKEGFIHLRAEVNGRNTSWCGQIEGDTIIMRKGPGDSMEKGKVLYRKVSEERIKDSTKEPPQAPAGTP